ncbi:MAG: hypothetical protein GY772_30520, partial [bacterium]|nr:hypothetical protein [bacterium]
MPAESDLALAGAWGQDRVKYTQPLWLSTGIRVRCAVLARTTRAQGIAVIDEWLSESRPQSRLLCAQIRWAEPVDGNEFHIIVVGHLHNSAARKAGQGRSEFCHRLLGYCARGARFLALDANMAMYGIVGLMAGRGVQMTLLAAHWEVGESGHALFDSMGIWAVGPIDLAATKVLNPRDHALAGAHHPWLEDTNHAYVARGYSAKQHVFPVPAYLADDSALAESTRHIRGNMVTMPAHLVDPVHGVQAWAPVRASEECCLLAFEQIPPVKPFGLFLPTPLDPRHYSQTRDFDVLPGCVEFLAQAVHRDPFGARWGRDGHWP